MDDFQIILDNLPIFVPLILLQMGLLITALIHVLRHPHYRFGSKGMWVAVVVIFQIIGPVIYFVFGRGDET